jgi:nucleotide-binding universal stress UspA family protein
MSLITKILVPVDFSVCSRAALGFATSLSERFEAPIHLLHAWDIPGHLRPDLTVWMGDVSGSLADHAEKEAKSAMSRFMEEAKLAAGPATTSEVVHGMPLEAILSCQTAGDFDLVVMGTHGRTGLSHLLLGSVAEGVVRRAKCPVLTVRSPMESAQRDRVAGG